MVKSSILDELMTNYENELQKVTIELKQSPKGHLTKENRRGTMTCVQNINENGCRTRVALKIDDSTIDALLRKEYLLHRRIELENELDSLARLKSHLDVGKSKNAAEYLLKRFDYVDESRILDAVYPQNKLSNQWEQEPYEQSNYMVWQKTQTSSRGLKIRSKSELVIVESLYRYGLPFHYEETIHIGTRQLVPDFTIRRADGKIYYWEHEGLTNSEEYLSRQQEKHRMYAAAGIVPWDNLIVTYDNESGNIDLRIVISEIENKLIL